MRADDALRRADRRGADRLLAGAGRPCNYGSCQGEAVQHLPCCSELPVAISIYMYMCRALFSNNIILCTDVYYLYFSTCVSKKHEHKSIYGSAPWVSPFAFARPDVRCAGARHITQLTGRTPSRELVARALVCP